MEKTRIEGDRFLAQCQECGAWVEVFFRETRTEIYFEHLEGEFWCCGRRQKALFTSEKDYIDFH